MCLITSQKKPKTARKNMVVYKALERKGPKTAVSPYQNYKYIIGKLYTTEIMSSDEWTTHDSIDALYLDKNYDGWRYKTTMKNLLMCIGKGFHATLTIERLNDDDDDDTTIYECVIPKGSKYHLDGTNQIVSNQIIIKSPIN